MQRMQKKSVANKQKTTGEAGVVAKVSDVLNVAHRYTRTYVARFGLRLSRLSLPYAPSGPGAH